MTPKGGGTPAVSILLPVNNGARHLPQALESLRAQTLSDYEVLLVDDGSDDDSAAVARHVWGHDSRLRILTPGKVGLVAALTCGLDQCRAPLVARMDADDIAHPLRLELQAALLADEPEVSIVGSQVACFREGGLAAGYAEYERWLNSLMDHEAMLREIFIESPLAHPSVLFRRQAIVALGGYRDRGWPEDYDLWLRAAKAGLSLAKVPQVLLRWRDHPTRHSREHPRYAARSILRCKAHHLARGPLDGRPGVVIWGAGKVGRRLRGYLEQEGARVMAFVDIDPRKIGRQIRGALVVSADELGRFESELVLAAVGSRGARELIRSRLCAMGRREGADFICVA